MLIYLPFSQIMKSYESSAATLRAILAHPSLQREKVDETLEAMASANADARDIDDAIRQGTEIAQADAGIDDSELEDELAALIKEAEQEKASAEADKTELKLSAPELSAPASLPVAEEGSVKEKAKEAI